eukprot:2800536-Rhodomonas_salina.1
MGPRNFSIAMPQYVYSGGRNLDRSSLRRKRFIVGSPITAYQYPGTRVHYVPRFRNSRGTRARLTSNEIQRGPIQRRRFCIKLLPNP